MTTKKRAHPVRPESTVGQILREIPEAMRLFQQYQAGTDGLCVITRDDTLEEMSDRFDVSLRTIIGELEILSSEAK